MGKGKGNASCVFEVPALQPRPFEVLRSAWQARAHRYLAAHHDLLDQASRLDAPEGVYAALEAVADAAVRVAEATTQGDLELANLSMDRQLVVLARRAARAAPLDQVSLLTTKAGLLDPLIPAAELQLAWDSCARRLRRPRPEPGAAGALSVLQMAAYGFDEGVGVTEAMALRERLARAIKRLRAVDDHGVGADLRERLVAAGRSQLQTLDSQLRAHADNDQLHIDGQRHVTCASLALITARTLVSARAREQLRVAEEVGAICENLIAQAGVPAFDTHILPTQTRAEFNTLFAPEVDAQRVQGAYLPSINAVVLSPGHSRLMCQPDARYPLYPVHLHELAHASACNGQRVAECPWERRVAEAYAEEVVARIMPAAVQALSQYHERDIVYSPSSAYAEERTLLRMFQERSSDDLLAALGRSEDMVQTLADRFAGGDRVRCTQAIADYFDGMPDAVEALLA